MWRTARSAVGRTGSELRFSLKPAKRTSRRRKPEFSMSRDGKASGRVNRRPFLLLRIGLAVKLRRFCRCLHLIELGGNIQLHIVRHDHTARLGHRVPHETVVEPINLTGNLKSSDLRTAEAGYRTVVRRIERYGALPTTNRQVACNLILTIRHPGHVVRLERDLRMVCRIEEIRRLEMRVALVVVGAQAVHICLEPDLRIGEIILLRLNGRGEVLEMPSD